MRSELRFSQWCEMVRPDLICNLVQCSVLDALGSATKDSCCMSLFRDLGLCVHIKIKMLLAFSFGPRIHLVQHLHQLLFLLLCFDFAPVAVNNKRLIFLFGWARRFPLPRQRSVRAG